MGFFDFIRRYLSKAGPVFELTHNSKIHRTAPTMVLAGKSAKPSRQSTEGDSGGNDKSDPARDYFERVVKLLPVETTVVFAALSANVIIDETDVTGHRWTVALCLITTAAIRFPLLTLPVGRRQPLVYALNLLVCVLWVYSVGGYWIDLGPRDDQFCWAIMFVLGAILPLFKIGNEKSTYSDE